VSCVGGLPGNRPMSTLLSVHEREERALSSTGKKGRPWEKSADKFPCSPCRNKEKKGPWPRLVVTQKREDPPRGPVDFLLLICQTPFTTRAKTEGPRE